MTDGYTGHRTLLSVIVSIGSGTYILKKNPEDDNLTKEALRSILNDNGEELKELLARMQKFNTNIVGSNSYFYK